MLLTLSAQESHWCIRREGMTTCDPTAVCPPVQKLKETICSLSRQGRALNGDSQCAGIQLEPREPQKGAGYTETLALVLSPHCPFGRLARRRRET